MTDKEKQINESFKDYKIQINVEEKSIDYCISNDCGLGIFYLKTNNFYMDYLFYYNLIEHLNNDNEMHEFLKSIMGKNINKKINVIC